MGFFLSGFDDPDAVDPSWQPRDVYDTFAVALAAAQKRMATTPSGRVDLIQLHGGSGKVIVSLSAAGVETISPVYDDGSDDEPSESFAATGRAAGETLSTVRSWRSTKIQTNHSLTGLVSLLDKYFGSNLQWRGRESGASGAPRFSYTYGKTIRAKGVDVWVGTWAAGRVSADQANSSVTLRFRPSRSVIFWFGFCSTFVVAILIALLNGNGGANPFPVAILGFLMFATPLVFLVRATRNYRREIDSEFIAACSGTRRKSRNRPGPRKKR
jgi:hypothetical protein